METGAHLPERHRPLGTPHSRGPRAAARCPVADCLRELVDSLLPRLAAELQLTEAAARTAMLSAYAALGRPRAQAVSPWLAELYTRAVAEAQGRRAMEAVYTPALWGARDAGVDEGLAEDAAMEHLLVHLTGSGPEIRNPGAWHRRGGRLRAATTRRTGQRRGGLATRELAASAGRGLPGGAGFGGAAPVDALERLVRERSPEHALACRVIEALREGVEACRRLAAEEVCAERRCSRPGPMIAALLRVDLPGEASQAELAELAGVKPETFSRYSTPYRARLRSLAAALLAEVLAEEDLDLRTEAGEAARDAVRELGVAVEARA